MNNNNLYRFYTLNGDFTSEWMTQKEKDKWLLDNRDKLYKKRIYYIFQQRGNPTTLYEHETKKITITPTETLIDNLI